jgi:hypothetical protein
MATDTVPVFDKALTQPHVLHSRDLTQTNLLKFTQSCASELLS